MTDTTDTTTESTATDGQQGKTRTAIEFYREKFADADEDEELGPFIDPKSDGREEVST